MSTAPRVRQFIIASIWLVIFAARLDAQCPAGCQPTQKANWDTGATYSVAIASDIPATAQNAIFVSMDYWNSYFAANGMAVPFYFTFYGPGQITIYVAPGLQNSGEGADYTHPATSGNGSIALNPDYFNDYQMMRTIMEHELGHGLGYDDIGTPSCNGTTAMYTNTQNGGTPSSLTSPTACDTAAESTAFPPPSYTGGGGCEGVLLNIGEDCSPIVINFLNGPYLLTGREAPVLFDINDTGRPLKIGWTAGGADEAFLCLDRNGNGTIDSGAELFGTATRLKNGSRAPNGFMALSEFDDNHDGVIDEQDPIWWRLLLWRDLNHDGVSQPWEITAVANSAITSFELDYHWTGRRDSSGNTFRYESRVWIREIERPIPRSVYDIFFVGVP